MIVLLLAYMTCAGVARRAQILADQLQSIADADSLRQSRGLGTSYAFAEHASSRRLSRRSSLRAFANASLDPSKRLASLLLGFGSPVALDLSVGVRPAVGSPTFTSVRPAIDIAMQTDGRQGAGALLKEREFADCIQKTAKSVERDIQNILRVEPNWRAFSTDLSLVDPSGTRLGLQKIQNLLCVVRRFIGIFVGKEEVSIKTSVTAGSSPMMTAQGNILVSGRGLPPPLPGSFKLKVDGSCKIHFNDQGKVREVLVDSWSFNGRPIELPVLRGGSNPEKLAPQDYVSLLMWTRKAIFGF